MIKNFIKGFIIGIAKIIPGVSGSMLAIAFGVYEEVLEIIASIKKLNMTKLKFLMTIGLGIILGIVLLSNIINQLLKEHYFTIMLLFIGLIIGTIKITTTQLKTISSKFTFIDIFIFTVSFLFCTILSLNLNIKIDIPSSFTYFIIGFIEAFCSVIPGISGTALFVSLNCYDIVLDFFSNIFLPTNLLMSFFFLIGFIMGLFILAKLITYLFKHYKKQTFIGVLGFMTSAIVIMIITTFKKGFTYNELFVGICLFVIGYIFIIKITNILENRTYN